MFISQTTRQHTDCKPFDCAHDMCVISISLLYLIISQIMRQHTHCKIVDCVHFVDNSSSALFEHFLLDLVFAASWAFFLSVVSRLVDKFPFDRDQQPHRAELVEVQ
jgi:hypothetical protein